MALKITTIQKMFYKGGGKLPRTLVVVLKNGRARDYLVHGLIIEKGEVVVEGAYIETNRRWRLSQDRTVLDLPGVHTK